jgi:hypothetical protein
MAGTAAAITLGSQVGINEAWAGPVPDGHQLPVAADADGDLLADSEEDALAYLVFEPDQNRNGTLDGVELAQLSAAKIKALPLEADAGPGETYKVEHLALGLETCDQCGMEINMGFLEVVNPTKALTVSCPFISLHYMEHGSFSYAGSVHEGRLDVVRLLEALELRLPNDNDDHQLPVAGDCDGDLISDREESAIGYQPFNDDQNRNEIPDGVELAKRCAAAVAELPEYYLFMPPPPEPNETYKIGHLVDGVEACDVCGESIHMGGWEIINPGLGLKYPDPEDELSGGFLPDLALHYMEHGSFDCHGQIHDGRVDIARLLRVLGLRFPNDPNEHQLPLDYSPKTPKEYAPDANDYDGDLLTDAEELTGGFNLYDPDQDANLVPDGIDLAGQFADAIDALPIWNPQEPLPEPQEPYKIDYFQRGQENCMICGTPVNMGWWQVVNPELRLSIDVYDIVCHYMHHGSFTYHGGMHGPDRINVPLLGQILEMPLRCGHLGTVYLPGDYNRDCVENFKDFSDFAQKWLQSTDPAEDDGGAPIMTYNIKPCPKSGEAEPPSPDEPTFSVHVEGPYILFEDMIRANCCPAKLELNMIREGNVIRLYEAEHFEMPCPCECDYPTDARLGPFEDGSYLVEVYRQLWDADGQLVSERLRGSSEVVVGARGK